MRRFLHRNRWATLSVVALLMFATSGMTLSRMTCLMGGHSVWALGLIEDCCPEEHHDSATISAECCELDQASAVASTFVGHSGPDLDALLLYMDAAPFTVIVSPEPAPPAWLESRRQPEFSGERLATLGSLLI